MVVLPTLMLPLDPTAAVRLRVPAVIGPAVLSVPAAAESVTSRVPLPMFDACTVVDAVSTIVADPEVLVACRLAALVLSI